MKWIPKNWRVGLSSRREKKVDFLSFFASQWVGRDKAWFQRKGPVSQRRTTSSGAKTNTPATYCTGPSTRHSTLVESEPTTPYVPIACARTVERPPASNFRTVHRYRFIIRTWSNFTTLRGLVRSQSCLVILYWTKQRKESARPEQRPTKTVIT